MHLYELFNKYGRCCMLTADSTCSAAGRLCKHNTTRYLQHHFSPFLSILISSCRGSKVPSLFFPRPSPGRQPIFWRSAMPMPPLTGEAVVSRS